MHKHILPNKRDFLIFSEKYYNKHKMYIELYIKHYSDAFIRKDGFDDFLYGHDDYVYLPISAAKKIIHLYRNTLDMIISYYYYAYKSTHDVSFSLKRHIDITENVLNTLYIHHYLFMKKMATLDARVLRVCYELLFMRPFETLLHIIQWLGLPVHTRGLAEAVKRSSASKVREEEARLGHAIHIGNKKGFCGSFVRSGQVSQWKMRFTDHEVERLENLLCQNDISFSEFILERGQVERERA